MKCETCGKGPMQGVTIHRTTPKGEDPHWRCESHMPQGATVAPEVAELVAIIEGSQKGTLQ